MSTRRHRPVPVVTALRWRKLGGRPGKPGTNHADLSGDLRTPRPPTPSLTCLHRLPGAGTRPQWELRLMERFDKLPHLVSRLLDAADRVVGFEEVGADMEELAVAVGDYQHVRFKNRTDAAISFGAPAALLALLQSLHHRLSSSAEQHLTATARMGLLRVANHALVAIRELTYSVHSLAGCAFEPVEAISLLLQFMKWSPCINPTIAALEEVLSFRPSMLQLADVDNFEDIVASLKSHQLAVFCRVLALMVYEPERHDPSMPMPATLLLEMALKGRRTMNVMDRNHSLLLGTPGLVKDLVAILDTPAQGAAGNVIPMTYATQLMGVPEALHGPPMDPMDLLAMLEEMSYQSSLEEPSPAGPSMIQNAANWLRAAVHPSAFPVVPPPSSPPRKAPAPSHLAAATGFTGALPAGASATLKAAVATAAVLPPGCAPASTRGDEVFAGAGACVGASSDIFDGLPPPREPATVRVSSSGRRSRGAPPAEATGLPATLESMANMVLPMHRVEVLFLLGGLMSGKRRTDVQDYLHHIGAIGVLRNVVLEADWSYEPHGPPQRIHGANCECNAESAPQIQLLRLLHALVDRDTDEPTDRWAPRSRMLTPEERGVVYKMDVDPDFVGPVPVQAAYQEALASSVEVAEGHLSLEDVLEGKGLAAVLVHLLMTAPKQSPCRFWLSSTIETFLRGAPLGARRWVSWSGLFQYLVATIAAAHDTAEARLGAGGEGDGGEGGDGEGGDGGHTTNQDKYSLQTSFDLLGECIKHNPEAFVMLGGTSEAAFAKIMTIACSRMVDSNVFLRSLLLTMDLCAHDAPRWRDTVDSSKVGAFMSKYRLQVLFRLMGTVRHSDVNQENICCLNTAVLSFVIADRRGTLPELFDALRTFVGNPEAWPPLETLPVEDQLPLSSAADCLHNFLGLLAFWETYYTTRGRDQRGLATSSGYSFDAWQRVVKLLASEKEVGGLRSLLPHL